MNGGDLMSILQKAYEKDLLRRYGYVPDNNIELLKLVLNNADLPLPELSIDNVEKLVSLPSDHSSSLHILKQLLAELEREERQPLVRKGQMRRTGRNQ